LIRGKEKEGDLLGECTGEELKAAVDKIKASEK
jgi:hypothetical protein